MINPERDRWRTDLQKLLLDDEEDEHWGAASQWAEWIADGFAYQGEERLASRFYVLADSFIPVGPEWEKWRCYVETFDEKAKP